MTLLRIPAARGARWRLFLFSPLQVRRIVPPMTFGGDSTHHREAGRPFGSLLLGAAGLCFMAVGAILWWQNGATVMRDYVVLALAWCF